MDEDYQKHIGQGGKKANSNLSFQVQLCFLHRSTEYVYDFEPAYMQDIEALFACISCLSCPAKAIHMRQTNKATHIANNEIQPHLIPATTKLL